MRTLLKRTGTRVLLLASVIGLSSFTLYKFAFDKNEVLMGNLLGILGQAHYSPVKYDDAFSEKVFTLYLKNIDYYKKFLTQADVDQMAKYRRDIDNQLDENRFDLYKLSIEILDKSIKQKETWYKEILSKPLNYNVDEDFETDYKKTKYAANDAELKKEWEKWLKYQIIYRLDESLTRQEKAKEKNDTTVKIKSFDTLEVEARRKVLKYNNDYFRDLRKTTNMERFGRYLNTIANVYDPHTEYFAPKEKKKFYQSMSGQFEGIGARLQKNELNGALKISEIIVGSPSYKQGELKAGDEIHKVAQGDGKPVDITDMDMDEAIDLIKGKKGTEVRLTVKKADGTEKIIPIIRDVIPMEDVLAKSVILNNNKHKVGYIYLPSFYTPFGGDGNNHCAADMRKEIEKLKAQNVEGLIVDLRNNGGGSLQEVVDMAGLFISKGPIVQVKSGKNIVNVMDDKNPDIAWSGPLTVMVNHNSASASEILAAAMQDYKRAVIVGTPTFGKGTVQSFVDLDQYLLPQFDSLKPIGSVKITMQKFYRINGGATQLKGVTPDVELPDPYALFDLGEKNMDYPMAWDEIAKANYAPFASINYEKVRKNSTDRVKKSPSYKLIETESKELKEKKDDSKYNLNLAKFRAEQKQIRDQNKKYEDLRKEIKDFSADILQEDIDRIGLSDTSRIGVRNRWAKSIAKDVYIHEAANIVNDMSVGNVAKIEPK